MRRRCNFACDILIYILLLIITFAIAVPRLSADHEPLISDYPPITIPQEIPDYTDPEAVKSLVRAFFADTPIMIEIARCESTWRHFLPSGEVLRGHVDPRDTGTFQINSFYHQATAEAMGLDIEDIHDNLTYAKHLYDTQGTQPWNASRHCWSG